MKKKMIYIVTFMLLINIFIINVHAATAQVGGGSYVPAPNNGSWSGGSTAVPQSRPIAYGYRVSIVDKKGKLAPLTHSVDYWSEWGLEYASNRKLGYYAINKEASYGSYGDSNSWIYYEIPKPKTLTRTENTKTTTSLSKNYLNYVKKSTYVDNNATERYEVVLTYAGKGNGGDKTIGNNYSRIALMLFKDKVDKKDYSFLYTILKDCNIEGDNDTQRAVNASNYYLLVEPLTAIYTTNNVTYGSIALGTPSDLMNMGILNKYSPYVYTYFMYINPVVFNNYKGGPVESCENTTNRDKILNNGCVGVFTMYIGDIVPNTCDSEARNIVDEYFNDGKYRSGKNEQSYINKLKSNEYTKKCIKDGKVTKKCNAIDPLSIEVFKGIGSNDACSNVNCGTQVESGLKLKYNDEDDIDRISSKLYNYWNDLGISYNLLKKNLYTILRPDQKPFCGNASKECKPGSSTIGNCSADMKFADNIDKDCWESGVAYNDVNNKQDYSLYQSSVDTHLSSNSCKVFCYESVNFDLPKNGSKTKAGKIFKWGLDADTSNSKFGTMNVTRICKGININNNTPCNPINKDIAYWTNKIATTIKIIYNEPISKQSITSELTAKMINYKYNNKIYTNSDEKFNISNETFKIEANYEFNYGNDLHWYSDKSNNSNLKTKEELGSDSSNYKYQELGFGLPTQFTTPTIKYELWNEDGYDWEKVTNSNEGYMYAEISKIGTPNNDNTYHFDRLVKLNSNSEGYFENGTVKYGCTYSVINELFDTECLGKDGNRICEGDITPKGLDVVFRTVELINIESNNINEEINKAFPGKAGNGRERGKNWNISEEELKEILDNNVYDKEPIYSIRLTSSAIQKIRRWNSNARREEIEPYLNIDTSIEPSDNTGFTGYKCSKGDKSKYPYCASEFLSELINDNSIEFNGTCTEEPNTLRRSNKYKEEICK